MTEFEFTSLHFEDEQTIKEIWELKYESVDHRHEGKNDENPQPLFVDTASSLFPTSFRKIWSVDLKEHKFN